MGLWIGRWLSVRLWVGFRFSLLVSHSGTSGWLGLAHFLADGKSPGQALSWNHHESLLPEQIWSLSISQSKYHGKAQVRDECPICSTRRHCKVIWQVIRNQNAFLGSVSQFSHLAMSDSLWPHESQHARPPCPPKPKSIESVMPSSHLILYRPLLLLPPILPSIRIFSSESTLRIRWPKYWSFSFNISPSNEHPGLISFRMDWLDLLAVQGTLKSLLQYHSSKASILLCSAFFTVQLSYPYVTTGKTIALTRQTFVGKVMFLLF